MKKDKEVLDTKVKELECKSVKEMSIEQIIYLCNHMDINEKIQVADFLEIECVQSLGCKGCVFGSLFFKNDSICPNIKCIDMDDCKSVIFKGNVK